MRLIVGLMLLFAAQPQHGYPREITLGAESKSQGATVKADGQTKKVEPENRPAVKAATSPRSQSGGGKRVCFVPIGDFPAGDLKELSEHFHRKFGLDIEVLPPIPVEDMVVDHARRQLVAEHLVGSMRRALPALASDQGVVLIGITAKDMYILNKKWRFAFGLRVPIARAAVVSTARMSLPNPDAPPQIANSRVRLRKMVTKDIGILVYGLTTNNNPRSVLFGRILGIIDLDAVGEDF